MIERWILLSYRCYSYVGRQGYVQTVSLARNGCLYHSTVQHELIHALGFNHEQTRSDRDNHIQVVWENVQDGILLITLISEEYIPRQQAVSAQIRPTSGPHEFHTGQIWAGSGPKLCCCLGIAIISGL